MTKNQFNALLLTAALSGLVGGTSVAAKAATNNGSTRVSGTTAGLLYTADDTKKPEKHACKGKNSCKGNGGCSTGDQGCKGKNTCKGKGGCATDGSKPPKVA